MTHSTFNVRGLKYRLATQDEIKALQEQGGAPHVYFGCTACGLGHWHAKNIALGSAGGYTGVRNIFYAGDSAECQCDPNALRCIVEA